VYSLFDSFDGYISNWTPVPAPLGFSGSIQFEEAKVNDPEIRLIGLNQTAHTFALEVKLPSCTA
jgi:hypothetical protein